MRPRVFPAEDRHGQMAAEQPRHASMRPRVFPAEDETPDTQIAKRVTPLQ